MSMQDKNNWDEDPRLTAYAFGELEGEERTAFEALIADDAQAQLLIVELRELGGALEEQFAAEPAMELGAAQRAAIENELGAAGQTKSKGVLLRGRFGWIGLAAASLIGTAVFLSRSTEESARVDNFAYDLFGSGDAPASERVAGLSSGAAPESPVRQSEVEPNGRLRGIGYVGADSTRKEQQELSDEMVESLNSLGYAAGSVGAVASAPREQAPATAAKVARPAFELERQRDRGEQAKFGRFYDDNEDADELAGESYARINENDFQLVANAPRSTFSIDVDTASYSNARRMLRDGRLPPADAVRIEEFINYFRYDYGAPTGNVPFNVSVEVGSAPWAPTHRLVRIGLQGKESLPSERKASNLVFLMDVSGSMRSPDKLPLLKEALHMLVQELDERDTVSIVVYAGASGLALPPTRCDRSVQVHMALEALEAGGSTNGGAGIELAYKTAADNFIKGGINRVILATDGDFNVGVSSDGSLSRLIEEKAKGGVFLTLLGFGTGNLQDSKMETLADKGNGNYAYIDSAFEARKVLVEQMGATLETIAKDVKIQVEFNPAEVQAYRLIGYENRMLATQDFNDDTKDAGEIGAGHRVTALYEVVPVGVALDIPGSDPLRYQSNSAASAQAFSGELCMLSLRYKEPEGDVSKLISTPIADSRSDFQELSEDTRWAATVAAFGMLLRDSAHKGTTTIADVSRWAIDSAGEDSGGYRAQFIGLVSRARELMGQ